MAGARRWPEPPTAARVAGWLLIAWIAIEVAFIREFSFLQVVYGAAGLAYVVLARHRSHAVTIPSDR